MTASWQLKLQEAFINWGIPALCSAIPFLAWIDFVTSFLRTLGWRTVTGVVSILVFLMVKLFLLLRASQSKYKELQNEVNNDYHQYMEPVPGKGVYRDKRNNEIICPRCVAERNIPSPMYRVNYYAEGWTYTCGACQNKVPC